MRGNERSEGMNGEGGCRGGAQRRRKGGVRGEGSRRRVGGGWIGGRGCKWKEFVKS